MKKPPSCPAGSMDFVAVSGPVWPESLAGQARSERILCSVIAPRLAFHPEPGVSTNTRRCGLVPRSPADGRATPEHVCYKPRKPSNSRNPRNLQAASVCQKAGNQRLGFFDLVCVFTRRSMCWQWLCAACSGRHPTLESGRLAESYALLLKSLGS